MIRDSAYLWIGPIVAMIAAQVLKPVLIMIQLRRFDWQKMRQSGGMPSSHTALVTALVTELWLRRGVHDTVLGIALLLALVVMYDAAGVRWQTGRHAAVLNRLLRDLQGRATIMPTSAGSAKHQPSPGNPLSSTKGRDEAQAIPQSISSIGRWNVVKVPWWLMDWPELNEHVGHKPTEVLGGVLVGIAVALYLH